MNKQHPLYQEDLQNVLSTKGIERLHGKSLLVTGATGLLGVHLIDVLMLMGDVKVYAVGRNKEKALDRLGEYFNNPNFIFVEQDVCSPFPENLKIDYIVPGASNTHPLAYSKYPVETMLANIKGAENALELASRCNATVLYPSSVEIYGNARENDVFTEDYTGQLNLSNSRACYTESKRACEALCQSYIAEKNVNVKIVRLSRIFGPTMLDSDTKASSQFIKKAVNQENIVLKSKGGQFFSYTYISDAVSAMLCVLLNGGNGIAYNVSNESCNVQLKDFAQTCADCCGKDVAFDLPSEQEQKGYSVASRAILSNERIKSIGFIPRYTLKDAINRTIQILK
jgi:nucleoside-diphosphate-sugar epimerase